MEDAARALLLDDGVTILAAVSFEKTPIEEISETYERILDSGWACSERLSDRWSAEFEKSFPFGTRVSVAEGELRSILGDHWADPPIAA